MENVFIEEKHSTSSECGCLYMARGLAGWLNDVDEYDVNDVLWPSQSPDVNRAEHL